MAASDAAVVCTEWPEIREADWDKVLAKAKEIVVIDANGFLANIVGNRQELTRRYLHTATHCSRRPREEISAVLGDDGVLVRSSTSPVVRNSGCFLLR
jgi:hypothetical protein